MRSLLPFVGALVGIALLCELRAQQDGSGAPAATTEERAAKAIADYENVADDPKKAVQATKLLKWLGETDHESITDYLDQRLKKAGESPAAVPFLMAVAGVSRPALERRVWSILQHDRAAHAVKLQAAAALMSMGNRQTDRLLDMLRKGGEAAKEPTRVATIAAVILTGEPDIIRGLVPLFDQGTSEDKLKYLRMLRAVKGVPEISKMRIRLISRGQILVAAVAWNQLAMEGETRAADLAIDLLERMPQGPAPEVAAEIIVGLAIVRDEELYPLLLRYGSSPGAPIKKALREAAPHAAKDPALLEWLAKYGLESDRPGERDAALMLLQKAPAAAVAPLVQKVRRALRRPRKESLDLAIGLHELLQKDPTWKEDVLKLAKSADATVRTVGLSLLRGLDCPDAIVYAQRSLGAREWELRVAALRYLTMYRDVATIPLLIGRYGKEEGRIRAEVDTALFVHTGTRCYKRSDWDAWWRKNKNGFVLPHEDTVRGGMSSVGGQTSAYHGIPLVSKKVAFLIDTSGSMGARMGTDRKRTRLEVAKTELRKVLEIVPRDFMVNLIPYSSGVTALWQELEVADDPNKDKIKKRILGMRPGGGTNIYGALERAFEDRNVDTIYLLTDGEPSAGAVVNADEIADEVARWNHLRQIVVHCIGLGIDSQLLRRLAEESGGVYKFVQ